MVVRPPDSLPALGCLHTNDRRGGSAGFTQQLLSESSPSSSEGSACSPQEGYRRLSERCRLALTLGGGGGGGGSGGSAARLLDTSDDDSTPLVPDTPTTPPTPGAEGAGSGGYTNEATDTTRPQHQHHPHIAPPADNCNGSSAGSWSESSLSCSSDNNNAPHEPALLNAPWYQAGIPREIALEVLGAGPVGGFLVRGSSSVRGCLALSVRVPEPAPARVCAANNPAHIHHYLILRTYKGYKIKGFTKEFSSLSALVTHHSVMPELLPCPLRLPRPAPAPRNPQPATPARAPPPPRNTPRVASMTCSSR